MCQLCYVVLFGYIILHCVQHVVFVSVLFYDMVFLSCFVKPSCVVMLCPVSALIARLFVHMGTDRLGQLSFQMWTKLWNIPVYSAIVAL